MKNLARIHEAPSLGGEGIHLAIDLSQGSAMTWLVSELAVALAEIGQRVSLPIALRKTPLRSVFRKSGMIR
jgi:hypothetical protein